MSAYAYLLQEDYDSAALKIQNVYEDYLTDDMWSMYNAVCSDTGVTGIKSEDSGDAEEEEEADMLANGINMRSDVYQAGHHGSSTASSWRLLTAVRPS